ncbi:hypothetical protein L9F63_002543, partial [Diploptera punctata]
TLSQRARNPCTRPFGACPFGESLRNIRHHTIRNMMAEALRDFGYTVYEEVHVSLVKRNDEHGYVHYGGLARVKPS